MFHVDKRPIFVWKDQKTPCVKFFLWTDLIPCRVTIMIRRIKVVRMLVKAVFQRAEVGKLDFLLSVEMNHFANLYEL